ncbi:SGNH/GDSL hydrolase family protein [Peribacillus sp. NJ11]|uniref:SGNH/GDSL hydrolase family protein n=1 Tax=Peribacillus sp. NJ11 TaxID=3055861 RepID=UPI0025A14725|nr:SGNH/GDSL hydrolase family protein [Peribacillus sp. NJ11]MDM5223029.1 SGNH/GDSL hydrolase family protein [Peribacillus sp. NJ11]
MQGKFKKIKDNNGSFIYPITRAEGVFVEDNKTLKQKLSEMVVGNSPNYIQNFYKGSKSGKKIVFVGDSTTDVAPALYNRFDTLYIGSGKLLEGATYLNRGADGNTVRNFVINVGKNPLNTVVADQADLYVLSYGINDIRVGGSVTQIRDDLKTVIDRMLNETSSYILLRIPNTFLTTSTASWVTPNELAEEYSSRLSEIYESFRGYSPRLDIIDIPNLVFGRKSLASHILMKDQLHPNDFGYRAIGDEIAEHISARKIDFSDFYDHEVIAKGWINNPATDLTLTTFKFFTNSSRTIQVDDVVYLGNSFSFVIKNAPTLNTGYWTITHEHVGSFNKYGTVKVLREKS